MTWASQDKGQPGRTLLAGRLGVCNTPSSPALAFWFTGSGECLSIGAT